MVESYSGPTPGTDLPAPPYIPFDKRNLSYATTFDNKSQAVAIKTLEWMTGKLTLLRLIRKFERSGVPEGHAFWAKALATMGITLTTPEDQIRRIPREGPVVVVANHPHGLVDGMVLAELIGQVRQDYRILTRSLLTGVDEVKRFMIPVPFPHEADALKQNLEMRRRAMDHLAAGGVIVLFPSGVVASSETMFGPAIEADWNPFTAKMVQRSRATVLPVFFPGQNSRLYQVANQISATLRQGLLIHEVVHSLNRAQGPVVGQPISPEEIDGWSDKPREMVDWLRDMTLSLRNV
ncbi:lysophospholipid acyltransferase family protein [Meridianimarinicoccus aquatilis]|uniref:Acyltransferase n=1 Tax=Meridianimarinicoccus aquatilis TaxID=2552766 RepID=A0A4R6B359_9RHOB|nr:lysophospholipid acyltransferase family protein [Fluviibacterium aquatile]QIE41292.1 acyltransferase [Rhodobacteraceae bacterium SC52]TDL90634.1 acyltransferase [Fluviibacterium aquatile]